MKAVNIYLFFLFWAGVAHAGSKADNPSFMMVSGISAADEMCLTAADGTRGQIYDCLLKLLCRVRVQEASALMVQQWFWSLALLLSQRGMAGNFGSSTSYHPIPSQRTVLDGSVQAVGEALLRHTS